MKKVIFPLLLLTAIAFQSCTKDFGKVEVTYTKATAVYSDLSEMRAIPLMGEVQPVVNPGKIFVAEDLILIGEEEKGIHVVDNTDPANPSAQAFINIPKNREYYIEGDHLYAESLYDMLKIDISDKNNPILISRVENAFAQDITNDNGEVLTGFTFEEVTEEVDGDSRLLDQIWGWNNVFFHDFANQLIPPSAVPASFAGTSSNAIGAVNRIAYQNNHVYVIGRSNMTIFEDQEELSFISTNPVGWQMETIFPHEDNIFVGSQTAMQIFDVSNPERPEVISSFWHATSCDPVYPVDDVAYVTLRTGDATDCPGDENSLVVLDISNISNPIETQSIEMESPYGLTLANDRLYVGEGSNGLKIYDATNRKQLELLTFDQSIEAYDVIHHPTRSDLLLVAGPEGLGQYEIEGTEKLALVSWLKL